MANLATNEVELAIDAKAVLGEGPHWDDKTQKLIWMDLMSKELHIYDPAAGSDKSYDLGQIGGCTVPRRSGGFIMGLQHGFFTYDLETERLTPIADPEAHLPGNRFNDGKCDPAGRLWAGSMSMHGAKDAGTLYRVDCDLTVTPMIRNVGISNGLGWSPDGATMYYIDTIAGHVRAFDYHAASGEIMNGRVVVAFPETEGFPDGMTVDSEGCIWVAHWSGYRVTRWNPATGECLSTIRIPAKNVTSCAFGGPELDELYITTARDSMTEAELAEYPHSGGVYRVKTAVKGMPAFVFGG